MTRDIEHWNSNVLRTDGPAFRVDEYVARIAHPEDYDLRQKLAEWRETGVVVFPACIDARLIDLLLEDITYLSAHRSAFDLTVEHKGVHYALRDLPLPPLSDTGIKFNCLETISLAARRLSLSRVVCSFLSHVFQDAPAVLQSLTFWRGSQQMAHLDYPWVRTQTKLPHLAASWIPLEDIHPDAGPLAYYPGSHKPGVIPPFDWGGGSLVQEPDSPQTAGHFVKYLADQVAARNLQKQIFLPKRGDVLLWHGGVLHEGTEVRDMARTRRSYVTHFTSLGAYPPDHRFPGALEKGRHTSEHGGYVFDHPWVKDSRELPSWRRAAI